MLVIFSTDTYKIRWYLEDELNYYKQLDMYIISLHTQKKNASGALRRRKSYFYMQMQSDKHSAQQVSNCIDRNKRLALYFGRLAELRHK